MKTKALFGLAALGAAFAISTTAHAGWSVSLNFGVPLACPPPVVVAPPVVCAPPVVYAPVVVPCPPPVVYAPPVVVCAPPVVVAPPVAYYGVTFGRPMPLPPGRGYWRPGPGGPPPMPYHRR